MKNYIPRTCVATAVLLACAAQLVCAQTPIKDVLAQIDPATGSAKDTATEFAVSGIVAARYVAAPDKVVAFIHNAGEPALAVSTDLQGAEKLVPRNVVKLAGKLGNGPFGAALQLNPASVSLVESNKPFKSNPINGAAFQDAAAFQGQYVVLNNVSFTTAKFDASGITKVKTADGAEVTVLLSQGAANHEAPTEATDLFGIVVKAGAEWQLVAVRFLPVSRKASQELATQKTCLGCHNPDTATIGPAYRDVAAKYRNDPDTISKLIAQMENGGTGKWGTNVMIPLKALVPPEEMKTLAHWVYSYRWDALLAE